MILIITRRFYRLFIVCIIVLLILPLLQFYLLRSVHPEEVNYFKPEGEAIKVSADGLENGGRSSVKTRFMHYLHDFYQNGL